MNVQTMTMPRAEAAERLRHYRKALHHRADAEYSVIAEGYKALARGTPILHLADVIRAAPLDDGGLPRLAVARSDQRQVRATRFPGGRIRFYSRWQWQQRDIENGDLSFTLDGDSVHAEGYALVPIVPPAAREGHAVLAKYLTLWEVEAWSPTPIGVRPDRDPYLLQPLGGDLYAVVAEWDLTELERAVMGARRLS